MWSVMGGGKWGGGEGGVGGEVEVGRRVERGSGMETARVEGTERDRALEQGCEQAG